MSYMFKSYDSIVDLDLSKFDTRKVKNMIGIFMDYGCRHLILAK